MRAAMLACKQEVFALPPKVILQCDIILVYVMLQRTIADITTEPTGEIAA